MNIAILAPMAAGAFLGNEEDSMGGAEKQLAQLGSALTRRGHVVNVIVGGESEQSETTPSGCLLWRRFPLSGPPVIKVLHPKGSSLLRALHDSGAELLLQRGAADLTGIGRGASSALNIPFVYAIASESDLDPGREIVPNPQDRILYRLGAGNADLIVAQTRAQAKQARRCFGAPVTRIPSFFHGGLDGPPGEPACDKILWGGNLRAVKRPEWLLALADRMPDRRFVVFGGAARGHELYASRIRKALQSRANVDYRGAVAPESLPAIYRECGVLLNSSETEGFPNTFLEAWNHGLQVVSSVDPDGLLADRGLGWTGDSLARLGDALSKALAEAPEARGRRRRLAWNYLESEHGASRLEERWETALQGLYESS